MDRQAFLNHQGRQSNRNDWHVHLVAMPRTKEFFAQRITCAENLLESYLIRIRAATQPMLAAAS
jgi:hypothetical protein